MATKNFLLKATSVGPDAGPFTVTDNLGNVVATGVTRDQLLAGFDLQIEETATSVTLSQNATCVSSFDVVLTKAPEPCYAVLGGDYSGLPEDEIDDAFAYRFGISTSSISNTSYDPSIPGIKAVISGTTTIPENSFIFWNDTSITKLIDCGTITEIGNENFNNNYSLSEIILPALTTIGNSNFFSGSPLTKIYLPSLTSISDVTFIGVSGQTIELTIPAAMNTAPAIVNLIANNTVTVINP